ncbi:MAG: hypothetical protein V7637_5671 [Mycobacteriales bacterium]|jgi:choice-of-anchor C domain-containing protein
MGKTLRRLGRFSVGTGVAGALVALSVLTAPAANAAPAFSNGSFEVPVVPANTFRPVSAGQPLGAWTVTRGNVDHIGAGFWPAADGTQSIDLDGSIAPNLAGAVAQTFSTLPLTTYIVKFALSGNPASGPVVKTGTASVNGTVLRSFSFDVSGITGLNLEYRQVKFSFLSLGTQATLEFASTTGSGFGPVIDDVTVTPCLLVICLNA